MANTKLKGHPVQLGGTELNLGDLAPKIALVAKDLSEKSVGGASGKYQIINVVPSLDTGVCATQTRKFNEKAAALPEVEVFVVSMDLPFAQGRFCATEGIENLTVLSDFRSKSFAQNYGMLLADGPLAGVTARAVFVVDPAGKIIYKELVPEITEEPNYELALGAIG